jgi:DnaJ-class molecular chaperone
MKNNLFKILQVSENASISDITKAYRKLAFKYHPDHNGKGSDVDKFHEIQKAYEILSDPIKRREHLDKIKCSTTVDPISYANKVWSSILND